MRSSKFVTVIAMTIAITAVMLLFKSGSFEKADKQMRNLLNSSQVSDICTAAINDPTKNYTTYYENSIANYSNTLANLFQVSSSNASQLLINYIQGGSTDNTQIENYVRQRGAPYLVFIAFAVICLVSWLFYFGCCCRPCCCCKKSEGDGCCKCLSVIIVLAAYAGIVIGCIIGFSFSSKFVNGLNGVTCSFLKFYEDVVNGQTTNVTPKWIGISGISDTLAKTSVALDQISAAFPTAFSANAWTTTDPPLFQNQLKAAYQKYQGQSLTNPNPAASLRNGVTTISPLYIKNYGDYSTQATALNIIYQEFTTKITGSITFIEKAQQYSTAVNLYMSDIKNTLSTIQGNINTFTASFSSIETNVVDNLINIQTTANNSGVSAFLVLFAILICLAALSTLCLLFFAILCHKQCLRYILHLIWNLTTIIMILTFLLGGIFGIVGLVGQDGVPVMQWVFGSENLNSASPMVITDKKTAGYINTCINGNGDLSSVFIPANSNSNYLDQLYQVSYNLSTTKATIVANQNSIAVAQLNTLYGNMTNNIVLTTDTSLGTNDILALLNEMRGWSDADQSKYQKDCSTSSYDVLMQTKDMCPTNYPYTSVGTAIGTKSCLAFSELTGAQVSTRYNGVSGCQSSGSTDFTSVSAALNAYTNALNQYVTDNTALLNQLISTNGEINQSFIAMSAKLITSLDKISGVINPLYTVFNQIVGNGGMFTLINCKFIATDLNFFYSQLQSNLAVNASSLGGVIIAVSFLEAISVFFLLIVIFKYTGDDRKEVKNAELKSA